LTPVAPGNDHVLTDIIRDSGKDKSGQGDNERHAQVGIKKDVMGNAAVGGQIVLAEQPQ
jgi:hypothetical protein